MARFTLSIADDIAAQLDAYAAENNLNRSQAAEHIFRSAFDSGSEGDAEEDQEEAEPAGDLAYLADQLLELQDYLTLLVANHQLLRNLVVTTTEIDDVTGAHYPRMLPEAPWVRRSQGY